MLRRINHSFAIRSKIRYKTYLRDSTPFSLPRFLFSFLLILETDQRKFKDISRLIQFNSRLSLKKRYKTYSTNGIRKKKLKRVLFATKEMIGRRKEMVPSPLPPFDIFFSPSRRPFVPFLAREERPMLHSQGLTWANGGIRNVGRNKAQIRGTTGWKEEKRSTKPDSRGCSTDTSPREPK